MFGGAENPVDELLNAGNPDNMFGLPQLDADAKPIDEPSEELYQSIDYEQSPSGMKIFRSRDQLDQLIINDIGSSVTLEKFWHKCDEQGQFVKDEEGKYVYINRMFVPRVSAFDVDKISQQISIIVATLFPNKNFFLTTIDFTKPYQASAQLHGILFSTVYAEIKRVVLIVCNIPDEKHNYFLKVMLPTDILMIFFRILQQEFNSPTLEALKREAHRLLVERFHLEQGLQQWLDITDTQLQNSAN